MTWHNVDTHIQVNKSALLRYGISTLGGNSGVRVLFIIGTSFCQAPRPAPIQQNESLPIGRVPRYAKRREHKAMETPYLREMGVKVV